MAQLAYIELDGVPATNYLVLKGNLPTNKQQIDYYWYEKDILPKEFACEIKDLLDFYETVVVAMPLPKKFLKEIEKYGNEIK